MNLGKCHPAGRLQSSTLSWAAGLGASRRGRLCAGQPPTQALGARLRGTQRAKSSFNIC